MYYKESNYEVFTHSGREHRHIEQLQKVMKRLGITIL